MPAIKVYAIVNSDTIGTGEVVINGHYFRLLAVIIPTTILNGQISWQSIRFMERDTPQKS